MKNEEGIGEKLFLSLVDYTLVCTTSHVVEVAENTILKIPVSIEVLSLIFCWGHFFNGFFIYVYFCSLFYFILFNYLYFCLFFIFSLVYRFLFFFCI